MTRELPADSIVDTITRRKPDRATGSTSAQVLVTFNLFSS